MQLSKRNIVIITASITAVLVIIAITTWFLFQTRPRENNDQKNTNNSNTYTTPPDYTNPSPTNSILPSITSTPEYAEDLPLAQLIWMQGPNGWQVMQGQTAPTCPASPYLTMPADISKVTSILYPGQTRGGNYKPHGGFRFDTTKDNTISVYAPIDGWIVRGGQYLAEGEIQYTFDVMNNCGVMYRVGHFREIPSNLMALTTSWPKAVEGDSRTHSVNPPVFVKKGELLATKVGIIKDRNTFFDWGVYDYRQRNAASASTTYQNAHQNDKELSWHAICWFNELPASDKAKVLSLPAGDPTSGKKSDYCK